MCAGIDLDMDGCGEREKGREGPRLIEIPVLEISDNVPVLRPAIARSPLPRLLPAAVLAAAGGVVGGPVAGAFLLAAAVRHYDVAGAFALAVGALPRLGAQ